MEGRGRYSEEDYGMDGMDMDGMGGGQGIAPLGCYGRESSLGSDKVYVGGKPGASLLDAMKFAARKGKRYVAVARSTHVDGHAFAFSEAPGDGGLDEFDDGCDMPCSDGEQYPCGCADAVCAQAGVRAVRGEDNIRRWIVYEVPPEVAAMLRAEAEQARAKASKGKKKGKKKAPKSEL